jgi:hypothetical protein
LSNWISGKLGDVPGAGFQNTDTQPVCVS